MTSQTSSAEPAALIAYADAGARIDAELEATSTRLASALAAFEATCREYRTGVTTDLSDRLRGFARRTADDDLWVRRVADAFIRADSNASATLAADSGTPVSEWSLTQKLMYAMERALKDLPADVADRLRAMLTPENLAALALVIGIWAASQAFGVGEVADVVLLGWAVVAFGGDAIQVGQDLGGFVLGIAGAKNEADLDQAGSKLANAVSIAGVDTVLAVLFRKAGERLPERSPSLAADAVTPEGFVVRVRTDLIEPGAEARMAISEPPPAEPVGGGGAPGAAGERLPPADTPEGKAARWSEYQARMGNDAWDYERWSRVYELNQTRATDANAAVNAYYEQVGWGRRELTVDAGGIPRRLDIGDAFTREGVEYKTGYQTATVDNLFEVSRDAVLVKKGWSITWVFEGTASAQLLKALSDAEIPYTFR